MPLIASEEIVAVSPASDGPNVGLCAVCEPAFRTLEMTPDLECKARKAIHRELRRIKLRSRFAIACFRFELFTLKARQLALQARCNLLRYVSKLTLNGHTPLH